MKLSTQPYKGTRDYYPEDLRLRNYIFSKWREVCQSFGYEEYDASVIEPLEIFTAKTSEEIVKEQTFSFEDRGGRKVTLRPEMTPTVSRMVAARRQELGYPLRLFSIPNCFRYERMQWGRTREFWQLNADLFGVEGVDADVEMILLADAILKSFGARPEQYVIKVNSRLAISELMEKAGLDSKLAPKFISALDKSEKMTEDAFSEYLNEQFGSKIAAQLMLFVQNTNGQEILQSASGQNLNKCVETLKGFGVNVEVDAGLSRGFDYYTDIVFEIFDKNSQKNKRSIFGGGRYDGLVGQFGVEPVPTVGFGLGDVTLVNFLSEHNLLPELQTPNHLYIMCDADDVSEAQAYANKLRQEGKNVAVDLTGRKRDKQFKSAKKLGFSDDQIEWFNK